MASLFRRGYDDKGLLWLTGRAERGLGPHLLLGRLYHRLYGLGRSLAAQTPCRGELPSELQVVCACVLLCAGASLLVQELFSFPQIMGSFGF